MQRVARVQYSRHAGTSSRLLSSSASGAHVGRCGRARRLRRASAHVGASRGCSSPRRVSIAVEHLGTAVEYADTHRVSSDRIARADDMAEASSRRSSTSAAHRIRCSPGIASRHDGYRRTSGDGPLACDQREEAAQVGPDALLTAQCPVHGSFSRIFFGFQTRGRGSQLLAPSIADTSSRVCASDAPGSASRGAAVGTCIEQNAQRGREQRDRGASASQSSTSGTAVEPAASAAPCGCATRATIVQAQRAAAFRRASTCAASAVTCPFAKQSDALACLSRGQGLWGTAVGNGGGL